MTIFFDRGEGGRGGGGGEIPRLENLCLLLTDPVEYSGVTI